MLEPRGLRRTGFRRVDEAYVEAGFGAAYLLHNSRLAFLRKLGP